MCVLCSGIRAHRLILWASSPFLRLIMEPDLDTYSFAVPLDLLRLVIRFIYTGKVDYKLNNAQLMQLNDAAKQFGLSELSWFCEIELNTRQYRATHFP